MQTPTQNTTLGKRPAPEGIATRSMAKVQKLMPPASDNECLFLTKLPQELRDQIYDDVAMSETKIGTHIALKEDSNVETHAYSHKGLGQTCRQIRQEYSLRLSSRIKPLLTELQARDTSAKTQDDPAQDPRKTSLLEHLELVSSQPYAIPPVPALDHSAQSHFLHVAERKVIRGVYIQEDAAYTMRIPFGGIDDFGLRLSTLTVTFATSASRDYNDTYPLDASRDEGALWEAKSRLTTLITAAGMLRKFIHRDADWTGHEAWRELFWDFTILFPWRVGNIGETYTGRSANDRWWKTLGNCFTYPRITQRVAKEAAPGNVVRYVWAGMEV